MKLPTSCEFCKYKGTYDVVTTEHCFGCKSFPVECPNNCFKVSRQSKGLVRFKREHLPKHLEEGCLLRVICSPRPTEVTVANGQVRAIPVTFTMTNFSKWKKTNGVWYSPPFFHTKNGYKLQLRVYPNGHDKSKGSHISVYVFVLRGEHDDSIQWPVYGEVKISILNRQTSKGHFTKQVYFPGDGFCYRLTKDEPPHWGKGCHDFFAHALLPYRKSSNTEYLLHNHVCLRVLDMKVFPPPLCPKLPNLRPSNPVSQFTVKDFAKCKETKTSFYSPPLYTSQQGYKLCLRIDGEATQKKNCINVSAHVMKGKHDHLLQWPLNADISIRLVNWQADQEHLVRPLYISDQAGEHGLQVKEQEMAEGSCGQCPVALATYFADVQYLQDGCLHFMIDDLVVYSTRALSRSPAWCSAAQSRPVHAFTLADFTKRKQHNNKYFSAPFYSHQNGYKMQLRVEANGNASGSGSHVSVFCGLVKGEHDDALEWPFRATVIIELLNWCKDSGHHKYTVHFNDQASADACAKPIEGATKEAWGTNCFIAHDALLKDDPLDGTKRLIEGECLRFQVKEVIVYNTVASKTPKIPAWQNPKSVNPFLEFTIPQFSKHKRTNNKYFGPAFYTHQNGYKMRLEVQANGYAEVEGTHISVFSCLMKGEHDGSLIWPFQGEISVELLNWKQNLGHHAVTTEFDGNTPGKYVNRVMEGESGLSFGYRKFLAHVDLYHNQANNIQYLMDDCLRFRVKDILVYSNALMRKVPRWQGGSQAVQFTVNSFTHRMKSNTKFFSTPFYAHRNGYKLRLEVDAGGQGNSKGSHVAVFARLLKGEHDDTLQWPLQASIAIDLLNWKKGSNHHRYVIALEENVPKLCRSRVMEGGTAPEGWGTVKFIAHTQLFPRYASDVEYREDDCLCFSITDIAVYSTPQVEKIPGWQKKPSKDSLCEFTIAQFSKRRQYNSVYYSEPFYSHKKGYKLQLQINLNGQDEGKGSHISVYARAVPGDFDARQKWPACIRVNILLINWKQSEERWHHSDAIRCVSKEPTNTGTFGTHTFIPHATLYHPPSNYINYLEDDCLRFRVKGTLIYSRKGIF